jgi:hypothetical protein
MKPLQPALLLLVVTLSAHGQQPLNGALFTNPEQRAYLDYLREDFLAKNLQEGFNIEESQVPEIPVASPVGPIGPAEYTLDGIMQRSDGSLRVWINNQTVTEQQLPPNSRLVRDGAIYALQFTTNAGPRMLRPGQTLVLEGGIVRERYQRPLPIQDGPSTTDGSASDTATEDVERIPETGGAVATDTDAARTSTGDNATTNTAVANDESAIAEELAETETLINDLTSNVKENSDKIQSMIDTLQALQESMNDVSE